MVGKMVIEPGCLHPLAVSDGIGATINVVEGVVPMGILDGNKETEREREGERERERERKGKRERERERIKIFII